MKTMPHIVGLLFLCIAQFAFAQGSNKNPAQTPTATPSTTNPGNVNAAAKPGAATTSQLQIVYPPFDIITDGSDAKSQTRFAVRATADKFNGLKIVAGSLRDEDSSAQLPAEAFLCKEGCSQEEISTSTLTPVTVALRRDWIRPGKYSGALWILATGDTAAQSLSFKVFIRPTYSWLLGGLVIAAGAALSWFALFWVARQRQLAANQVLIARLGRVLSNLTQVLQSVTSANAPAPTQSLAHIEEIKKDRLAELMHDKELSIIAGVTVPQVAMFPSLMRSTA